jgi:hypothetical protein
MIDEGTEVKRTRGRRRILSRGRKTIGIHVKTGAYHQKNNEEGFYSASSL